MRVLVCGDRFWTDKELIKAELAKRLPIHEVIHGDTNGADKLAAEAAEELGIRTIIPVPAEWAKYHKAAGPIRNAAMLKKCPHLVLAFHDDIERSRGTKNMLDQAYRAGIPYSLVGHQKEVSSEKD